VSIVFGGLLIALGVWGYVTTSMVSWTALIPAFFGGALALLGVLALKESLLKHAMHAAALVGVVGFLAAAGRFVQGLRNPDAKQAALISTGGMALLCAAFVGCCVNSFIQARRRRAARAAAEAGAPR
jgi:hypothetical protein